MPMFTDETVPQSQRSVTATPSLACDLSWLLSVAARPSMQARYPQLAEMFNGREDLADRVRNFWGDGSDETCFTEMQVLAHHAGALGETDPDALWRAIEAAVATVPLDLEHPVREPRGPRRCTWTASASSGSPPSCCGRTWTSSRRSGGPWTTCGNRRCPSSRRPGVTSWPSTSAVGHWRHSYLRGVTSCRERLPEIVSNLEAGRAAPLRPLPVLRIEHVPRVLRPRRDRDRRRAGRRRGAGADRVGGAAPEGGGRSHPPRPPALAGDRAEHRRRARHAVPAGPAHREHARQGAPPERARAIGAAGRPAPAERRPGGGRVAAR